MREAKEKSSNHPFIHYYVPIFFLNQLLLIALSPFAQRSSQGQDHEIAQATNL